MEKKILNRDAEKLMYTGVLIFSAVFLFWNIHDIMFTVHDDMRIYTITRLHKIFESALSFAKKGRITHLWNTVLLAVPFAANSVTVYKIFSFGSIIFDAAAMYILLKNHAGRQMAYISLLIFFTFATLSPDHNLLTAYALCHQIPIGLILVSFNMDLNYLKTGRKICLVLSVLSYMAAGMIYEAFIPFVIFYAGFGIFKYYNIKKAELDVKGFLINFLAHLIPAIIYTGVYFLWKVKYPSSYDGNSIYFSEPFLSLKVVYDYSTSYSPIFQFFDLVQRHSMSFGDFISSITLGSLLKAMSVSFVIYVCFQKMTVKIPEYLILLFSGAGIFLPNLITGFTEKYAKWGKNGYLSSFYSYFFMIVFAVTALHMIYKPIKTRTGKRMFLYSLFVITFFCSITSDITTDVWGDYYRTLYVKYQNFDAAVSDEFITGLSNDTDVYIPDNTGINGSMKYTEDYVSIYTDRNLKFHTDASELDFSHKTVCMRYKAEYSVIVMGYIDEDFTAEKLYISTADDNAYTIKMLLDDGSMVLYENVKDGDVIISEHGKKFDLSENLSD